MGCPSGSLSGQTWVLRETSARYHSPQPSMRSRKTGSFPNPSSQVNQRARTVPLASIPSTRSAASAGLVAKTVSAGMAQACQRSR